MTLTQRAWWCLVFQVSEWPLSNYYFLLFFENIKIIKSDWVWPGVNGQNKNVVMLFPIIQIYLPAEDKLVI